MKKYLIIILIFVFLGGGIFLPRDFNSEKEIIFHIEKGQGSREIALNLEKEDLIRWGAIFRAYVLIRGASGKLQAGYYFLSPSMNIPEITEKFATGDMAKIKITIPEGYTSEQIYPKIKNVTMTDIVTLKKYEGYLFPDTYEITYGMKEEEIIKMMTDNFDRKTAGLKITPEVVIMASLLEKEVKTKEEKELVSGILWKRLKVGIPLQVDATITYITGKKTIKISKEDTQIESPYNTYKYYGLPSGPICNPGLESILAALYPKNSDYWYYLSSPDGDTIFSKTLEEHNHAKEKYLR